MLLKDFLKFVRDDEIINLYMPSKNIYLQIEVSKQDYDNSYDECLVVGLESDLTSGYFPVLEISIEAN